MFKPISLHDAPLKEGRLPLAMPSSKELSAKRAQRIRQIFLGVLVLLLLRTISVLYIWPSDDIPSVEDLKAHEILPQSAPPAAVTPPQPTSTPAQQDGAKDFPKLKVDGVDDAVEDPVLVAGPARPGQMPLGGHDDAAPPSRGYKTPQGGLDRAHPSTKAQHKFTYRPDFEKALQRVVSLLPSELEMRGLLRPMELTGEAKLRELGMLARKYKQIYEAWEDLHVETDAEGGTHTRDDVIQYLRYQASAAGGDSAEHDDLVARIHAYEDFRRLLVQLNDLLFPFTAPYFPDHLTLRSHLRKGGRGIALTAGNDQVAYLLTQIPILRQLGCHLPIEVMYVGDGDLNKDSRQDLEDLDGVVTRDIAAMVKPVGWSIGSWAAKPFAILLSSFREVIFIDADSFFFVNPEVMFEYPEYVKTGALFFRDRLIMPESKKSWLQSVLPQPVSRNVKHSRLWTGESGHQQESGVLVVDTYRHFIAMLFVTRMNGPDRDGDRDNGKVGVYDMVYGESSVVLLRHVEFADAETQKQATRRPSGLGLSSSATPTTSFTRATLASSVFWRRSQSQSLRQSLRRRRSSRSASVTSLMIQRARSLRTRIQTTPKTATSQTKSQTRRSPKTSQTTPPRPTTTSPQTTPPQKQAKTPPTTTAPQTKKKPSSPSPRPPSPPKKKPAAQAAQDTRSAPRSSSTST